jgi:hypothetical protein
VILILSNKIGTQGESVLRVRNCRRLWSPSGNFNRNFVFISFNFFNYSRAVGYGWSWSCFKDWWDFSRSKC